MKYAGMVLGGILSAIGHMVAFIFKNVFIAIRRFSMDPANKNAIWNLQAFSMLCVLILLFLWLVGRYQDIIFGLKDPVFLRAIPLLLPCFLGHMIYSSPALFKNSYSKPIIQTFLNAFSILALGQILMRFIPVTYGVPLAFVLLLGTVALTLYYTLHLSIKNTVWNKLNKVVEEVESQEAGIGNGTVALQNNSNTANLSDLETVDLNEKGCLSHLRYYSEECKLELFQTVPTKERQSELVVLNRTDRAQHAQIIGGTGAGKTLLATNLISQDLLNDYIGSTIIEPKGSLINRLSNFMERTGRPFRRLDPEYEFSDCLNPLYVPEKEDIEPMIEANVSAFHGYLGPDAVQYFKSRATNLLRVGIKALKLAYGNDVTYNELDRLVQPINDDYRAEVLSELRGQENLVPLLIEYTRNMAGSQKTQEHAMQTYSNLYDYLSELTANRHIQKIFCGPSTFNIDDALKNGEVVLVNGAYGTLQTLTYTVGRLYLNLLRASTFRRNLKEKVRPHQLTVDEIEMFADEEFSTFMEMAREFEVFVNVIHQGNVQLDDVSERLGTMVKQNAVQKFILAGLDVEDAQYYADMIGEDYKIGQSTGTDEMEATGFKTQLKEEKRYTVLPKEILNLKGYNPETGEYGECLFRGVHNNVRQDPVIGIVLPLSRRLFSPLTTESAEVIELVGETGEDVDPGNEDGNSIDNHQLVVQEKKDILTQVKQKAKERREQKNGGKSKPVGNVAVAEKETSTKEQEEDRGIPVRRSSVWDKPAEATESAIDSVIEPEKEVIKEIIPEAEEAGHGTNIVFQPATVDQTVQQLAERMRNEARGARESKGTSEAE
ncbi:type IV secretory system conjugative DNA transfer family protein [Paenibacillus alkaliterrae]|uniref:type IV secretory system conjugative DNA transfer family protein n=1 Tax=Paenibacillus alkaliterrae TaxID=320909 RepID=UPI001F3CBF4B|nr:type IV secretory system conjugative DNA transfer family protein [Paenibacillus alkaliterrae]MCF2940558.1 type IV secretory system conjugative DNA transfer family protein [Paenibacillus alkaliterrae]